MSLLIFTLGMEAEQGLFESLMATSKVAFRRGLKAMLLEWWDLHREELIQNWQLAKDRKQIKPIAPLE